MESSILHMERLLTDSPEPLSFIVIMPDYREPTPAALERLESSQFKRKQVTIPAFEHEFRHGFQHVLSRLVLRVRFAPQFRPHTVSKSFPGFFLSAIEF